MDKISKQKLRSILSKRFDNDTCLKLSQIPKPNLLKDIKKAALRIKKAIDENEKVAIVGDYDADGVISSVILSEFFDDLGLKYILKIPNRFKDGYGLNPDIVKELDVSLIITVDNGISAIQAAQECEKKGIDLIITDHHTPQEILPKAYAIVNPKQSDCNFPNAEICGAQVAWYLCATIKKVCNIKYNLSKFIDLLAIAIMADMMELVDMNRILVKKGIEQLNLKKRPAISAIAKVFKKFEINCDDISYLIAPLINSSGRMDDAMLSYELLRARSLEKAFIVLEKLINLNNDRKEEEKRIYDISLNSIKEEDRVIVVWGERWHEGVIGIVASRLSRNFNKPAFVFSVDGQNARGSARSVGKLNLLKLISKQEDLVCEYGGHKGAAGLSVNADKLSNFRNSINDICSQLDLSLWEDDDEILGELSLEDIDFELLEILEYFEPYGQKNPKPNFIAKNLEVQYMQFFGKDNNHLKLFLKDNNSSMEALFFNYDANIKEGSVLNFVFSVSKNTFRGLVSPQILIQKLL